MHNHDHLPWSSTVRFLGTALVFARVVLDDSSIGIHGVADVGSALRLKLVVILLVWLFIGNRTYTRINTEASDLDVITTPSII